MMEHKEAQFYLKCECPAAFQPFLSLCLVSAAPVPLGGPEENQRIILGLGGHDPLYQQQPALAARRAQ